MNPHQALREQVGRTDRLYNRRLAEAIYERFVVRLDKIPTWGRDGFYARTVPTERAKRDNYIDLIAKSLEGDLGMAKHIGAYSGDNVTGRCKTTILDIDAHKPGEEAQWQLLAVKAAIAHMGAPPYQVCSSKSGKGRHIIFRHEEPIPLVAAHNFGRLVVDLAQHFTGGKTLRIEVFPKQTELSVDGPGSVGGQVALPVSGFFHAKTGGACLLDPATDEPYPYEAWEQHYREDPKLDLATLRWIGSKTGRDLWRKPGAKVVVDAEGNEHVVEPPKLSKFIVSGDGVPDFKETRELQDWLEEQGFAMLPPKSRGDTDIICFRECPNSAAHGSSRGDGAAVLFTPSNRRVGFKCHHAGCEGISWPKLLRKLGFRVRVTKEAEGGSAEEKRPEEKPKRKYRGIMRLKEKDRKALLKFAIIQANSDIEGFAKLAKRARRCANCCALVQTTECVANGDRGGHGPQGMRARPCDDEIFCTRCAQRGSDLREQFTKEEWPEEGVVHVRLSGVRGDRMGLREIKAREFKRIKSACARQSGPLPVFVEGIGHVDMYWPIKRQRFAEALYPTAAVITRDEAARMIGETWYEPHALFLEKYYTEGTAEPLVAIRDWPWYNAPNLHRCGGGKESGLLLPFFDIKKARKKRKAEWEKAHPGCEIDDCMHVIGTTADGKPIYCGNKLKSTLTHKPTGKLLAVKFGSFNERDELRALDATNVEREWAWSGPPVWFGVKPEPAHSDYEHADSGG